MTQTNRDDSFDPTVRDRRCNACQRIPWDPRVWDLLARYNRRKILATQPVSTSLESAGPFHHRSVCELHIKYRQLEEDAPHARDIRNKFHEHSECQDDLGFARRCMQNDSELGIGDVGEFRKGSSLTERAESDQIHGRGGLRQFEVEYLQSLLSDPPGFDEDTDCYNNPEDGGSSCGTSTWGNLVKYFKDNPAATSNDDTSSTSVFRTDPIVNGRLTLFFNHHMSDSALISAAAAGCHLCQTFRTLLHIHWLRNEPWEESCIVKIGLSENPGDPGSVTFGFSQQREASLPLTKIPFWTSQREVLPQIQSWSASGDPDLQHIVSQVIDPWIHDCDQGQGLHKHCRPSSDSKTERLLPTRLIDVGERMDSPIRLVETSSSIFQDTVETPRYCSLSYCWGITNEHAKTTRSNLHERLDEIEMRHIPKTIRDAIRLTRALRVRYLWVDVLCIIQRHPEDPYLEDFFREAPKMGSYYSNAYCLISALSADDSSVGLFPDGEVGKYDTKPRMVGYNQAHDEAWVVSNTTEIVETELRVHTPALQRGWCLQERLLSPRILHWSTVGVFWQCQGMEASEWRPEGKALSSHGSKLLLAREYDSILTEPRKERATGELWTNIITTYQLMQLSQEVDRLNAIQGLGNKLASIHGDEYFAGIFLSQAASGLLWQGEKRPEFLNGSEDFPTWSWGPARHSTFMKPQVSLVRKISSPTSLSPPSAKMESDGLRGGREMRRLRLEAPLVDMFDLKITGIGVDRAATWKYRDLQLELHFDDESLIPGETEGVQVLLLGYMEGMNPLLGIAVRNNEADRRYMERIGFVVVRPGEAAGNVTSFVERYMSTVDLI